jgi:hypothetical protein
MKKLLVLASVFVVCISFASSPENADCSTKSAQYFGKTINWQSNGNSMSCIYQIELTQFFPAHSCGISSVDASNAWLTDQYCQLGNDKEINGRLIEENGMISQD